MTSFAKIATSFSVAFVGIKSSLSERNVRFHFAAAIAVCSAGFYFQIARWEWCALVFAIGLVLAVELLNTAIEKLADVIRDEQNLSREATKLTRDIAAGAVLLASISSLAIGLLIFIPKIFA